jgi:hypothetical protein
MEKIIELKALDNYKLYLKYNDGVEGSIDLSDVVGKGVFKDFEDEVFFKNVWIGESGAPTWNNELDIDPLNSYLKLIGKTFEEYMAERKHKRAS